MKLKFAVISFLFFTPLLMKEAGLRAQVTRDSVFDLYMDFVRSKNQAQREENCRNFSEALHKALSADIKGDLPFDSLKRYKVMIQSPDNQVRIFTWDLEAEDGTHTFFGFIHFYVKKLKKYEVYELKDKSDGMKDPENALLDNTKWFGAYYYEVIPVKYKKKKYYVLLGWDGNNRTSNKRLIDVLHFSDKGFPKFGEPFFSDEKGKVKKRLIFEYQAGLFMSLKYDEAMGGILFDHLSPSNPALEGEYSFYGPDFSYDMLEFKDGKWLYRKDVLPRNDKGRPDKHFNNPK